MERKPQQHTLSLRISEPLREFLERSRQVISTGRVDPVSLSDVAKILLESAKEDRLDVRLEVADLYRNATESLSLIRAKWHQRQPLSRAEWILLAEYVQIGCEELSENPRMPEPEAYIPVLEAVMAVRSLRAKPDRDLDRYYLGNLGIPESTSEQDRSDPGLMVSVVENLIEVLRNSAIATKPALAGRNFYVALRDESLGDMVRLNDVLLAFLPTLFRLAARGHWIRERQPLRQIRQGGPVYDTYVRPVTDGSFQLTAHVSAQNELHLVLSMIARDVSYPIETYPQIREFAAMLAQLDSGKIWNGTHFLGSATRSGSSAPAQFHFHRHRDGVRFSFSEEEWTALHRLFSKILLDPGLQPLLDELALVYGEL